MIDYVEPRYKVHTITVAEFQKQCLDFINEIAAAKAAGRRVDVLILDDNDAVLALLSNYDEPPPIDRPKFHVEILGDIVSPMPAEWFAVPDAATGETR